METDVATEMAASAEDAVAVSGGSHHAHSFWYEVEHDPYFHVDPKVRGLLRAVVREAKDGNNPVVGLRGPTGTGKTSLPVWLAAEVNKGVDPGDDDYRNVYVLDVTTIREPKDLFGFKDFVQDGHGNVKLIWRKAAFVEAVRTPNAIIILDEATRIPASVMNGTLPLLDHRGKVWLEDLGEVIEVAPGVIFFVTANVGLQYTGTFKWDAAFQNRMWWQIGVDYLEPDVEVEVLVNKVDGLDEDVARRLVECANEVRSQVRDEAENLTESISTRQLLNAGRLIRQGMPPRHALLFTVEENYSTAGGTDSERATLLNIVHGKFGS